MEKIFPLCIKPDNAHGIVADVANIVFGQSWKTGKNVPGKAVRQDTKKIKSETLESGTKNKEIADVHISGTTSCGSQVVTKVRSPYC